MTYKILVAEDDTDIQEVLRLYLVNSGFEVISAYDGSEAYELMLSEKPDLALLDIMMPVINGYELTKKIREISNIPIIILSAMNADSDKILGLDIGADDYITKPFNPLEVAARVGSQLRRYTKLGAGLVSDKALTVGGIELDNETKTVTVDGKPVSLTPKEYDILKLLMEHPGKVYAPKELYKEIWGEDALTGGENTVAVHIRHIREKIEITPNEPRYLKVVFGQGYKIEKER